MRRGVFTRGFTLGLGTHFSDALENLRGRKVGKNLAISVSIVTLKTVTNRVGQICQGTPLYIVLTAGFVYISESVFSKNSFPVAIELYV